MKKSLTHSTAFWLVPVLSLLSAGIGGWLIAGQVGTMTTTLVAGTATGLEVYVGQSLVVLGSALLGAGVLGLLITFALVAVQSLIPAPRAAADGSPKLDGESAETVTPIGAERVDDDQDQAQPSPAPSAPEAGSDDDVQEDVQNGSSGSIATATKISVK